MTLAVRERTIRDVAILNLTGSLTVGPSLALLESRANRVLQEFKPARLILNVEGLIQVDSAGLGEIMILYTTAAAMQCRLAFVGPQKNFRQVLRITRVDGIVPSFDDEATALSQP
jgi:anti-anti-sigma factor